MKIFVPSELHGSETKSAPADLNSRWLVRSAIYMDVFCNPVTFLVKTLINNLLDTRLFQASRLPPLGPHLVRSIAE
jgi:hypothetical protein